MLPRLLLTLLLVSLSLDGRCLAEKAQRYQPIDPKTFTHYTELWRAHHRSWIGASDRALCDEQFFATIYPICTADDKLLQTLSASLFVAENNGSAAVQQVQQHLQRCVSALCARRVAGYVSTPSDTLDYLPPSLSPHTSNNINNNNYNNDNSNSTVCGSESITDAWLSTYSLSLDEGIAPDHLPVTPVRLLFSGTVLGLFNEKVEPVAEAEITLWQTDPLRLRPLTAQSKFEYAVDQEKSNSNININTGTVDERGPFSQVSPSLSLKDLSCRASQRSAHNGSFSFHTVLPFSHGPPRYLALRVAAAGFETLFTRVYFDRDWRLQQLTTLHGERTSSLGTDSQRIALGFSADEGHTERETTRGAVNKDPRVASLHFITTSNLTTTGSSTRQVKGYFQVNHDLVLSPVRRQDHERRSASLSLLDTDISLSPAPPLSLDGVWADESSGALVQVETQGSFFLAREIPHTRVWGSLSGYLVGNAIHGVLFRSTKKSDTERDAVSGEEWSASLALSSSQSLSALIVAADASATAPFSPRSPQSMAIHWQGAGGLNGARWTKQDTLRNENNAPGTGYYRYLKVMITRTFTEDPANEIALNEIVFYEGILTDKERPSVAEYMKTPRSPSPQKVTCSSFLSQETHCYKAFDGDASAHSVWRTKPGGLRQRELSQPQWILLDMGPGRGVRPTAVRIVCDAANTHSGSPPQGCPLTFSVLGSLDNTHFDTLTKVDLFDYNPDTDYRSPQGRTFYFVFDTVQGRINGERCPSCETGPLFACNLQGFDAHCNSLYCNDKGRCDAPPECPAGRYLSMQYDAPFSRSSFSLSISYASRSFVCLLCPAGRYGASAGLTKSFCSGACDAGYYCPPGSTSPRERECGSVSVYCPQGCVSPIPAPAGRKTLPSSLRNDNGSGSMSSVDYSLGSRSVLSLFRTQAYTQLCAPGHFCVDGEEIPCPAGRYGNSTGLAVSDCSGECPAGYHCPAGSVVPLLCEKGHYCDDGITMKACPAGHYGAERGLSRADCSGLCTVGYYCEIGEVSPRANPCPAGRYGDRAGLQNDSCTALCPAGYYCPSATAKFTDFPCGGETVYCPKGSVAPLPVSAGYYTVGGESVLTRTTQYIAEPGYYALDGLRFPCPAGSFGNSSGLSANDPELTNSPSFAPSFAPSFHPTRVPSSAAPSSSHSPSLSPSRSPTLQPTAPTRTPSLSPSVSPSRSPSFSPSRSPTLSPTLSTSESPSLQPTSSPSYAIDSSLSPTFAPSQENQYVRSRFFCTGLCPRGHYCPLNSTTEIPCPAGKFGATEGLFDAQCSGDCPLGHYCPEASIEPIPCPAGRFGQYTGLTDATCSKDCSVTGCDAATSTCSAGYYCPVGSIYSKQYECGGPGNRFILAFSFYFAFNVFCFVDKYCPPGSVQPIQVSLGFYTVTEAQVLSANDPNYVYDHGASPSTRSSQRICEEGYFCINGERSPCPPGRFGDKNGLSSPECSGFCPPGYYCLSGTVNATMNKCPLGRYGSTHGLTSSACTGSCDAGYHCPAGSTSPREYQCGVLDRRVLDFLSWRSLIDGTAAANDRSITNVDYLDDLRASLFKSASNDSAAATILLDEPNSVYCPQGSERPLPVLPGYYSIGNNRTVRHDQRPCLPGSYCMRGVRYSCPGGRYGATERLSHPDCSGICSKGFYCPAGSVSSRQYPCPIGRFGDREGLDSSACSGACPHPLDCPLGSTTPRPRLIAGN